MRTRISGTEPGRSSGFTLIELLAVLTVLSLIAATVMMRPGVQNGGAQAKIAVASLISLLRQTRMDAIVAGREHVVVIDIGRQRIFEKDNGNSIPLPKGLQVSAKVAGSEHYTADSAGIRFFPNGASSGGTISIGYRGEVSEINVNWLNGRVSLAGGH
ncbi:prepilin-type N-terminal cleavage/methylation domain-containing protein [soil metagenome]